MLEYYDYFGLYTTARNYICVHSELNLNKSLTYLSKISKKDNQVNIFFQEFFTTKIFKKHKYFLKKYR